MERKKRKKYHARAKSWNGGYCHSDFDLPFTSGVNQSSRVYLAATTTTAGPIQTPGDLNPMINTEQKTCPDLNPVPAPDHRNQPSPDE